MKILRSAAIMAMSMGGLPVMAQDAPPPAVTVAKAAMQEVSQTLTYNGRLSAEQSVELVARVTGTLQEVGFQPGDSVDAGALLFRIEPDQYSANVRQAEGALAAAQATVIDARIERDRQAELVQRKAVAQTSLDSAEAALGRAQGSVQQAEAALDTAKLNLSYTTVLAPFPGRVGERSVDPGALVGPTAGPLVSLTKLDPIHVNFMVPTAEYRKAMQAIEAGNVKADSAVRIVLADGEEYASAGRLDFVDSTINPGTNSVALRATFDNPEGNLLNEELVRVKLASSSADPVLTVPIGAIQRDLVGDFVMLVNDQDEVEQRRVTVARETGNLAVISDGLADGDRVITEGMNKVRAGIKVDAAEAGAEADAAGSSGADAAQPEAETEQKDG